MEDWKILIDRAMQQETENTIEAHKIYGDAVRSALAQTQMLLGDLEAAQVIEALYGALVRTCRSDAKGDASSGYHREGQSTDAEHRGGAARSRDEGPVMGLDQRGCVVQPRPLANC
jgi:hypothetical protein